MSASRVSLPTNEKDLAVVINNHVARELSRTSYWRLCRLMYHYYFGGARHFSEFNTSSGKIHWGYTDSDGNLYFRSQKLLQIINQFIGHSLSADWRPSVTRTDMSLAGIRERAVSQVVLDACVTPSSMTTFLPDAFFFFWAHGGVGITGDLINGPDGPVVDLQAINPTELMPFPSIGVDKTKATGLVWRRFLSHEVLKERFGTKFTRTPPGELVSFKLQIGDSEQTSSLVGGSATGGAGLVLMGGAAGSPGVGGSESTTAEMYDVREVWIDGPGGYCERYIVQCGNTILQDEDLRGKSVRCPVRYIRCLDDGTWHGQGIADLLFSHIREGEKMLSYFLENVRSQSNYDLLVLPQSAFDQQTAFRDIGRGLGVVTWAPEPFGDNRNPMTVRQATSGEIPGKVVAMMDQMVREMAFPEILQGNAPGRVDSTSGLEFLDEQARKALNAPIGNLQTGFGALYQALSDKIISSFRSTQLPVPISRLTLDLAGLVMSPSSNSVVLHNNSNPIPDTSRLVFTVKNAAPKNPAALKQEAREYLTNQQMSVTQFQYYCIQQGLDVAMPLGRTRNAYENGVKRALILFNDGQTPGEITVTPWSTVPDIEIMILEEFMPSVIFAQASPEVQDAFMLYYEKLQQQMGIVLPPGYMNPDDYIIGRSADISQPQGQPQ